MTAPQEAPAVLYLDNAVKKLRIKIVVPTLANTR